MYISYTTSNMYAPYAGISLTSLFENNKEIQELETYILVDDISIDNTDKFLELGKIYGRKIEFIYVNELTEKLAKAYNIKEFNGSSIIYARMFPHLVFPENIDKILCIDSDTIIIGKLNGICDINMNGFAIAMAENPELEYDPHMLSNDEYKVFQKYKKYYNEGITLYNLIEYKKYDIASYICSEIEKNNSHKFANQSVIYCGVPHKYIKSLSLKYNSFFHLYSRYEINENIQKYSTVYNEKDIRDAIEDPVILHYKGYNSRPWFKESISSKKDEYLKYKNISPWRNIKQQSYFKSTQFVEKSIRNKIKDGITTLSYQTYFYYLLKKLLKK